MVSYLQHFMENVFSRILPMSERCRQFIFKHFNTWNNYQKSTMKLSLYGKSHTILPSPYLKSGGWFNKNWLIIYNTEVPTKVPTKLVIVSYKIPFPSIGALKVPGFILFCYIIFEWIPILPIHQFCLSWTSESTYSKNSDDQWIS